MAGALTVKNTFFDFDDTNAATSKRSSSLPRSWKPLWGLACEDSDKNVPPSDGDASTVDSDECCSVADIEGSCSGMSSSESDQCRWCDVEPQDDTPSKIRLCLNQAISADAAARSTKLSSKARMFEPISSLPMDMRLVLMAARAAFSGSPKILNVRMSESCLGGVTTLTGYYVKGSLNVGEVIQTLALVKIALLDAAASSENTYLLGYAKQPFNEESGSGFSARLGLVPTAQEDTACWDTYQNGFCYRRSTCWRCHPQESDLLTVAVALNEIDQ